MRHLLLCRGHLGQDTDPNNEGDGRALTTMVRHRGAIGSSPMANGDEQLCGQPAGHDILTQAVIRKRDADPLLPFLT